jgi:hypothetical protein
VWLRVADRFAPIHEERAMGDMEAYRALFGLTEPWTVAGVDVDMARQWV